MDDSTQHIATLGYSHINLVGRYTFALSSQVAQGALRPLRSDKPLDKLRKLFS